MSSVDINHLLNFALWPGLKLAFVFQVGDNPVNTRELVNKNPTRIFATSLNLYTCLVRRHLLLQIKKYVWNRPKESVTPVTCAASWRMKNYLFTFFLHLLIPKHLAYFYFQQMALLWFISYHHMPGFDLTPADLHQPFLLKDALPTELTLYYFFWSCIPCTPIQTLDGRAYYGWTLEHFACKKKLRNWKMTIIYKFTSTLSDRFGGLRLRGFSSLSLVCWKNEVSSLKPTRLTSS